MPDGQAPADPVEVFRALCWARAHLWRECYIEDAIEAVDPLQQWARANGLVRLIGQDDVQAIIGEAFKEAGHKGAQP